MMITIWDDDNHEESEAKMKADMSYRYRLPSGIQVECECANFEDTNGEPCISSDTYGISPLFVGRKYKSSGGCAVYVAPEVKALVGLADTVTAMPPNSHVGSAGNIWSDNEVPILRYEELTNDVRVAEEVRSSVEVSIRLMLGNPERLGVFLSGGLDSSIIAAVASQHVDELHTFSVGIKDSWDLLKARQFANHIGSTHHEEEISVEDILEALPDLIYHLESYDEDFVETAVSWYFLSQLAAANKIDFVLSGEGADEIFAGHHWFIELVDYPKEMHLILHQAIEDWYRVNLKRIDRTTKAFGLSIRLPFVDREVINLGMSISPRMKVFGPTRIDKWILRKAFENILPEDVTWSSKKQHGQGAGIEGVLQEAMNDCTSPEIAAAYAHKYLDHNIRSIRECGYHKIFMEQFRDPGLMIQLLKNSPR